MNTIIKVLDHGYVRLEDAMGSDASVVRSARVSYDGDHMLDTLEDRDVKLINYLMANKHTSPFEAVTFTFEVKAPIFVFRQWHRHRTWSFNEVSARYTELPAEYYVPEVSQITTQSSKNKQQRTDERHPMAEAFQSRMVQAAQEAFYHYSRMIADGCPRELARSVLPVSTYSRMYATVDLHNLLHFIRLRDHDHAQYEVRVYAQAMRQLVRSIVPACMEAFDFSQKHEASIKDKAWRYDELTK